MKSLIAVLVFFPSWAFCQIELAKVISVKDDADSTKFIEGFKSHYHERVEDVAYFIFRTDSKSYLLDKQEILYALSDGLNKEQVQTLYKAKSLTAITTGIESSLDTILKEQESVEVQEVEPENMAIEEIIENNLGLIKMISKEVTTYKVPKKKFIKDICKRPTLTQKGKVRIKRVTVGFHQGFMNRIRIETLDGRRFDLEDGDPISLLRYKKFINTPIPDRENETFIKVGEVLDVQLDPRLAFGPNDTTYVLNNFETHEINQVYGINNLLELDISSDLLGVFESEDNGLVIFELGMNFPLNLSGFRTKYNEPWALHFFRDVKIDFRYARLDQKEEGIVLNENKIQSALNTLQRADLSFRGDLNVVKLGPVSDRIDLSLLNFFGELNSVELLDLDNDESIRYNTVAVGFGIRPSIWRNPQFGIQFHLDVFRLIPYDDFVIDNMPDAIDCLRWGCKIQYFTKEDLSSSVFGKFNMVDNIESNDGEFYQFSIGYRMPILSNKKISDRLKRGG